MILGEFDSSGRPFVTGRLTLPRFGIIRDINFLVDTGAYATCMHPTDGLLARVPFCRLENPVSPRGVGGSATYFIESAVLEFVEIGAVEVRSHQVEILIAKPDPNPRYSSYGVHSLLGRDVLDRWRMLYDRTDNLLEITVRRS